MPQGRDGPLPAAVLVGGLKRGRRVVGVRGLDAIARGAILVSPDYPLDSHRRAWRGPALATAVARVRPGALDAVASVPLLLDYDLVAEWLVERARLPLFRTADSH